MSQPKLKEYVFEYLTNNGYKPVMREKFVYAKGTVPVLLVAHLDTVHKDLPRKISCDKGRLSAVEGIGGDDRCGVYMIMKLIRNNKCSVLFTEDEEIGGIGAWEFCKSKYVNELGVKYIIELDRKGSDDAVFYDCDNERFTEFVTCDELGFKENWGTFTDISYICETSGIAGVNLSCGYYNAHTKVEYVEMAIMENNIKRVERLIKKPVDKVFKYIRAKTDNYWSDYYRCYGKTERKTTTTSQYSYGSGYYGDYYDYDDARGAYGGSYYGRNLSTPPKSENHVCTIEVEYQNADTKETIIAIHSASTKYEAFYEFFRTHPDVCYLDIIDWYIIDDTDDYEVIK